MGAAHSRWLARVAELADAEGLNPSAPPGACGFESRPGHDWRCQESSTVAETTGQRRFVVRTGVAGLPSFVSQLSLTLLPGGDLLSGTFAEVIYGKWGSISG